MSRRLFRLTNRRDMDRTSNALAAVTTSPAFLDITISRIIEVSSRSAKTPLRLGKAKRHCDASALFRRRAPGTFGFLRMLVFTGARSDDGQTRNAVADLSNRKPPGSLV